MFVSIRVPVADPDPEIRGGGGGGGLSKKNVFSALRVCHFGLEITGGGGGGDGPPGPLLWIRQ